MKVLDKLENWVLMNRPRTVATVLLVVSAAYLAAAAGFLILLVQQ